MNKISTNQENHKESLDFQEQSISAQKKAERLELAKKELPNYVRIGDKYYKKVSVPDKFGRVNSQFVIREKSTIIDDFGRSFLSGVKRYDGFCTVPSHVDFKETVNGFFNEYKKISHSPQQGEFPTILQILNHIFQDKIEFILDYIQILYLNPTQRLPILLLESAEKSTGKSTFGTLLNLIFEDNAIKLGNSDFESEFNSIWIKRLCIIVDETSLEKKSIMQLLKRLSTETRKVNSNEKNVKQTQVDFIGKFIFMSNDECKALPIEKDDDRFAVFKVNSLNAIGFEEITNIEPIILKEIPAFLHFLKNRKRFHHSNGRLYFHPSVYETVQLQKYQKNNMSIAAKAIKEMVSDTFSYFPDETVLKFSLTQIINELSNGKYLKTIDRMKVKQALEELNIGEEKIQRYRYHSRYGKDVLSEESYKSENCNNRVYTFTKPKTLDFTT